MQRSTTYSMPLIASGELIIPRLIPMPDLLSRGIKAETLKEFNIFSTGRPFEIASLINDEDDNTVGVHIRAGGWNGGEKKSHWLPGSKRLFFGLNRAKPDRKTFIFEGQTDACSAYQVWGEEHNYLAMCGTPSPELLQRFKEDVLRLAGETLDVVLGFDDDPQGHVYTRQWEDLLEDTDIKLSYIDFRGHKDLCECVLAGDEPVVLNSPQLPPNLLHGSTVAERIQFGADGKLNMDYRSTGWQTLDYLIGGYFPGQLIVVAGHPKQGKSTFVAGLASRHLELYPDQNVMLIPLELTPETTLGWVALGLSMPPDEALVYAAKRCYCVQHFGYLVPEQLKSHFRAIKRLGISLVVIDHITAACTSFEDGLQNSHLEAMISFLKSETNKTGVTCIVVTHVNMSGSPEAKIMSNQLRGSYSLAQLPDVVLGVTREPSYTAVYTVMPDRHTGKTGTTYLEYDNQQFKERSFY